MSTNATQDSRNSGNNRRRRNRGGSNRNQNERGPREHSDERGPRGADSNDRGQNRRHDHKRSDEFRPQASRPARTYAPVKVSFWQKILNAIGLGKKPAATPARPERKPRNTESTPFPTGERAPKSNTRNARSGEGDSRPAREPREPREPRAPREKRPEGDREERSRGGNRSGDRPRGGDPKSVESTRVYVGNLSYDVTEQDLQELFKGIGGVRNIEIVYNRSTHRSKGYGFVEMLRLDDAVRCVEVLHDQPFMGRKMTVSGAKSKGQDEREDMEGRNEAEPIRVVLASTQPAAMPNAEAPAAVEASAVTAVAEAPVTEVVVAEVAEAVVERIVEPAPQAVAATDLETVYAFEPKEEEAKEKTEEA